MEESKDRGTFAQRASAKKTGDFGENLLLDSTESKSKYFNSEVTLNDFVARGRSPSEVQDNNLEKQNEKAMNRWAKVIDMKSY